MTLVQDKHIIHSLISTTIKKKNLKLLLFILSLILWCKSLLVISLLSYLPEAFNGVSLNICTIIFYLGLSFFFFSGARQRVFFLLFKRTENAGPVISAYCGFLCRFYLFFLFFFIAFVLLFYFACSWNSLLKSNCISSKDFS